jgi:hypothetical protein
MEVIIFAGKRHPLRPGKSPGRTLYFGDKYNIPEKPNSDYWSV